MEVRNKDSIATVEEAVARKVGQQMSEHLWIRTLHVTRLPWPAFARAGPQRG
jgi:hypothetical protein